MENETKNVELSEEEQAKIAEMRENGELNVKTEISKNGFFQKVKSFCAKHWRKAAITAGGGALLAAGYFIGKAYSKPYSEDYELVGQDDEPTWTVKDPLEVDPPEEPVD